MQLTHRQAVLVMVVVTLLWSTAGVVTRQLEHARSFEVTFWRSLFTLLSLLVILPWLRGHSGAGGQGTPGLAQRQGVRGVWQQLRRAPQALWLSGLCWSVMFTAFMVALTLTTVANVLVTMSIGPLLTALGARLFLGDRLPARTWMAILVAGAGIAWIYGEQVGQGSWLGSLVALAVPVAGATNWTLSQRARARGENVDLVPAVLVGAVISTLVTFPLALPFEASVRDIGWLALLGLMQLAIPCVLAVVCARVLQAPEISLLALLEVIFGILLAWLGAGEVPGPQVLAGGALVIGALLIHEWLGWRQRP
jgi:drug/metabolite transporter (DMT)-like permease